MNKVVAISLIILLATLGFSAYAYTVILPGMSSNSNSSTGLGGSGTGSLNIYLTDAPAHNATLKYLLVNVTSVTLKYSTNQTATTTTTSSTSESSSTSSSSSTSTSTTSTASSTSSSSSSTSSASEGSGFRFVYNVSSSVGLNVNLTKLQGSQLLLGATNKAPAGNVTGIILNISGAEAFWTNGNHSQLKVVADGKLMINVHFAVQSNGTTNLTLDVTPGDLHVSPGNQTVLRPVIHATAVSSGPQGTHTVETTETQTESSSS